MVAGKVIAPIAENSVTACKTAQLLFLHDGLNTIYMYNLRPLMKILTMALMLAIALSGIAQKKPYNILFIAVDDLKPELGCYGNPVIKTPNIDRLAKSGTVFQSNYCQQAVCGPTRASLMTGMRPDYTRVWDLKTTMRSMNPDILSLPQHLIAQGYSTQGIGKVYDPRCVDKDLDKPSWSVPYYKLNPRYFPAGMQEPSTGRYQSPDTRALAAQYAAEAAARGMTKAEINEYINKKVRPTTECMDVPDNAYVDGANTLQARDILIQLSKSNKPFFFAVGLSKPHLPFVAPKKYWDLYDRKALSLAPFQEKPGNGVDMAMHNAGEIRSYTDIPPVVAATPQKGYGLTLPEQKQRELVHGYYATISYTDANVGILLNTLDSLGLRDNTIIVLWGDHGWHLGDHNLWCKHSNFEQATRAPLIISAPGMKPGTTRSLSEFVDIFPTLCDLTGVNIPGHLDGRSLVPLMKNPKASVKEYAVSQYPRSGAAAESQRLGFSDGNVMGYSIRTGRYRYTLWMGGGYRSNQPYDEKRIAGRELYDYEKDPQEKENLATDPQYSKVVREMHEHMLAFFKSQQQ
jgi:arylsulfatase A-like enzyme